MTIDISELRKALEGVTDAPWHPGHLCRDDHSCNCTSILADNGRMGGVAQVSVDDGTNDCPPLSEAKANQRFIATFSPPVVRELLDEIERLDTQRQWQPIKTAPRDGSIVWLWNKHVSHPADAPQRFWWSTHYSVFGLGGCWTDGLCTMGDGIDFDFWCAALPAAFTNPYEPAITGRAHD